MFDNLMRMEKNAVNDMNSVRCQVRTVATKNEKVSKLGSRSMNILSRICRRKFVIAGPVLDGSWCSQNHEMAFGKAGQNPSMRISKNSGAGPDE